MLFKPSRQYAGAISIEKEKFGEDSIAFDAVTMTKNTNLEVTCLEVGEWKRMTKKVITG